MAGARPPVLEHGPKPVTASENASYWDLRTLTAEHCAVLLRCSKPAGEAAA